MTPVNKVANAKHIATYPLYASALSYLCGGDPAYTTRRVGTGYVYSVEDYYKVKHKLESRNHPFHPRWRNGQCRVDFLNAISEKA